MLQCFMINLQRLKKSIPDVKLILAVRNPIKRLVSEIVHHYTASRGVLHDVMKPEQIDDFILRNVNFTEKQTCNKTNKHLFFYKLLFQYFLTMLTTTLTMFQSTSQLQRYLIKVSCMLLMETI